jgi:zinc transport system permease protein
MIFDTFFAYAALAGIGIALAAGPLGCFVVWRRMAYFGDATAHAAILGVALALTFEVSVGLGVLITAVAMALGVFAMSGRGLAIDTLLGVVAHSALAIGVLAISMNGARGVSLEAWLFGDILAVDAAGLMKIWAGAALVGLLLCYRWSALLMATLGDDLARAEGIDPARERLILMLSVAVLVAIALKVVGALLVTAMLIIPAATARGLSRSPEGMAFLAAFLGALAAVTGLVVAFIWDAPAGPGIVAMSALGFALSLPVSLILRARRPAVRTPQG